MTCLPPPGTASGTTHVLRGPDGPLVVATFERDGGYPAWSLHGTRGCTLTRAAWLERTRFSYLGPFMPPAEVDRLRAENERLRLELRTIAELPMHQQDNMVSANMRAVARAALEPPHAE